MKVRPLLLLLLGVFGLFCALPAASEKPVMKVHHELEKIQIGNAEFYSFRLPIGYDRSTERISYSYLPRVTLKVERTAEGAPKISAYLLNSYNDAEASQSSHYTLVTRDKGASSPLFAAQVKHAEGETLAPAETKMLRDFYAGALSLPVAKQAFLHPEAARYSKIAVKEVLQELSAGPHAQSNRQVLQKLGLSNDSVMQSFYFPDERLLMREDDILEELVLSTEASLAYRQIEEKLRARKMTVREFLKRVSSPGYKKLLKDNYEKSNAFFRKFLEPGAHESERAVEALKQN
jgi:hypothetical protein